MNGLRERLYPNGFRPMRFGPPLFAEANLDPHYWPFKGIVWSMVVHGVLLSAFITIPMLIVEDERPRFEEALILDADDFDMLYLPMLGSRTPKVAENSEKPKLNETPAAKEGLSYPGPQPILSKFPVPTNHTQTILQPTRPAPIPLDPSLMLPNVVRLPAPMMERKLAVPEVTTPLAQQQAALTQPDLALKAPEKPLAAPTAESRMRVPEQTVAARPGALTSPFPPVDNLTGPSKALAAPVAESKLKVPEQTAQAARPTAPNIQNPQLDGQLTGPLKPLAAPLVESRFKLPEVVSPIARPALPVAVGDAALGLSGPTRALAAPLAESRISVPDATTPGRQPSRTTQIMPPDIPMAVSAAGPLAAPRAESRIKVPEATTATTAVPGVPVGPGGPGSGSTKLDAPLSGPSRPLAAPLAESRIRVPEATSSTAATRSTTSSSNTTKLDVPLSAPSRALPAPVAESRLKVPEASTSVARPAPAIAPLDNPAASVQPLVALSPTPGRRDLPVAVPPGEARGNFAISPQPNLTFPGTEPGARAGNGTSPNANNTIGNNPGSTANNRNSGPGTNSSNSGVDAFPGITILGAGDNPGNSRNTITIAGAGDAADKNAVPLQTSYGITIIASGGSGGGLPDLGVFANEQVHTVYLDMRKTIQEEPISWTAAFGIKHPEATSLNERETNVGGQQEVSLPFPITKERPVMAADLVRKYPGRLVIAYAVVNTEGKLEQLSVKQSPDPLLNDAVLTALRKWTFRPARRNGEVIPAKILLGVPVRTN